MSTEDKQIENMIYLEEVAHDYLTQSVDIEDYESGQVDRDLGDVFYQLQDAYTDEDTQELDYEAYAACLEDFLYSMNRQRVWILLAAWIHYSHTRNLPDNFKNHYLSIDDTLKLTFWPFFGVRIFSQYNQNPKLTQLAHKNDLLEALKQMPETMAESATEYIEFILANTYSSEAQESLEDFKKRKLREVTRHVVVGD